MTDLSDTTVRAGCLNAAELVNETYTATSRAVAANASARRLDITVGLQRCRLRAAVLQERGATRPWKNRGSPDADADRCNVPHWSSPLFSPRQHADQTINQKPINVASDSEPLRVRLRPTAGLAHTSSASARRASIICVQKSVARALHKKALESTGV